MKILFFIFFNLFSIDVFAAFGITECVYSNVTGTTACNDVLDPTAIVLPPPSPLPPIYDNLMHASCPVGKLIFVDTVTGAVSCIPDPNAAPTVVKIAYSISAPDPSKDDVACDPSKGGVTGDCASETTAKKANELASEANSKLGSIANSSATSSGLLGKIIDAIKGIGSGGTGSGTTGTGTTGTGSGGTAPPTDEPGVPLTNDIKTVDFSAAMGASGSCPSDIPFNILGSSYSISYQPVCDFADQIRGVVIALGAFAALSVVVTAL